MALCAMGWCESPKRRYGSGFFRFRPSNHPAAACGRCFPSLSKLGVSHNFLLDTEGVRLVNCPRESWRAGNQREEPGTNPGDDRQSAGSFASKVVAAYL